MVLHQAWVSVERLFTGSAGAGAREKLSNNETLKVDVLVCEIWIFGELSQK